MQVNTQDNNPLHAPINARLAEIVESASPPPPWYHAWIQLGPDSSEEDRLTVYRAVWDSGCLPADAGFYLVSWQFDAMASMDVEIGLNHLDDRMQAIEQERGLAAGEFWPPGRNCFFQTGTWLAWRPAGQLGKINIAFAIVTRPRIKPHEAPS